MTTATADTQETPKNLLLRKRKEEDAKTFIAAARGIATETNTPTNVYPQGKQASQPTYAQPPQPAPEPEHVTTIEAPLPTVEKKARGPRPAPVRRYSVDLPLYVIDAIHQLAHDKRTTKKRVFLEALQAGGIKVKDIDIHESGQVLKGRTNG